MHANDVASSVLNKHLSSLSSSTVSPLCWTWFWCQWLRKKAVALKNSYALHQLKAIWIMSRSSLPIYALASSYLASYLLWHCAINAWHTYHAFGSSYFCCCIWCQPLRSHFCWPLYSIQVRQLIKWAYWHRTWTDWITKKIFRFFVRLVYYAKVGGFLCYLGPFLIVVYNDKMLDFIYPAFNSAAALKILNMFDMYGMKGEFEILEICEIWRFFEIFCIFSNFFKFLRFFVIFPTKLILKCPPFSLSRLGIFIRIPNGSFEWRLNTWTLRIPLGSNSWLHLSLFLSVACIPWQMWYTKTILLPSNAIILLQWIQNIQIKWWQHRCGHWFG